MNFIQVTRIALIVLVLVMSLQGCSDAQLSESEYVAKAKGHQDLGDLNSAVIELKNALRSNPKGTESRWLLGNIYLEMGRGTEAEKELLKAGELGVVDEAILPLLMKALLLQKKYTEVLEWDASSVQGDKAAAEILTSRGVSYLYKKDFKQAKQELSKALEKNQASQPALVAMADLSVAERNLDMAQEYLDKALSIDTKYPPLYSSLGNVYENKGEIEKAIEWYTKAIDSRFDNATDLLKRSLLFVQSKKYGKAKEGIARLKKHFPNYVGAYYAEGMMYFYQSDLAKAQVALEKVKINDEYDIWATFYLGAVHYLQGNYERARVFLSKFVSAAPGYIPGRKFLALVKSKDKEYVEVDNLIRPIVKAVPDDVFALNLLANSLANQGKNDEAIKLFEKIVDIQPESAAARMHLGLGLMGSGDAESGLETLKSAIEIDPEFTQAEVMLVLSYLKQGDYEKAQQVAEPFVSREAGDVVAHNLLGKVFLARKNEAGAVRIFQAARELAPGDIEANTRLAVIAINGKEYEKAREYYEEILKHHENDPQTLINLAALEAQHGDRSAVEPILKTAIEVYPNAIHPRILLVRDYLKKENLGQARIVLWEILDKNRDNPVVLSLWGEVQLASNEFEDAKSTFQRLVELQPKVAKAHLLLARAYSGLSDFGALESELDKTLELAPDNLEAKIAKIRMLLVKGEIEAASKNLALLKKGESKAGMELQMLEAAILEKSGNLEEAHKIYKSLYMQYPSMVTLRPLVRFEWELGNKHESVSRLEGWVTDHPDDIGGKLELANVYLGVERQADAVQQYRQVLHLSENNLIALNNLAWHFRETDPARAFIYVEKASSLAPESIPVMDTLAMLLLEKGDLERAKRLNKTTLEKRPGDPSLLYHRALILEKKGQKQEAKNQLEELLKRDLPFREENEAEQTLKRLTDK